MTSNLEAGPVLFSKIFLILMCHDSINLYKGEKSLSQSLEKHQRSSKSEKPDGWTFHG